MTQREKLTKAILMAQAIKGVAKSLELEYDAKDYDCSFPLAHARYLNNLADEFLKLV